MDARVIIRPAVMDDLEAISRLHTESILETVQDGCNSRQARQWLAATSSARTSDRIRDGCVLVALAGNAVVAAGSLDLEDGELRSLFVKPSSQRQGIGRRLVTEIERLAIRFGIQELRIQASPPSAGFFRACQYVPLGVPARKADPRTGLACHTLARAFPRRQTRYGRRIARLLERIGIPGDYGRRRALRLQPESRQLATIGSDTQGRDIMLHPKAAMAWYALRNAAQGDGIELQVVSAFRSVGRQVAIIENKRQAGQSVEEILHTSAAPGYSEHHAGFALDLCCPGSRLLDQSFENTVAFEWLAGNAHRHGFGMSYPRNNRHGIAYEPWHWKFRP